MRTKPFLKWVGGKTQIMDELFKRFPTRMEAYTELFLGGGSVLIELLNCLDENSARVSRIVANDYNSVLVETYKIIKENPEKLIEDLEYLVSLYEKCSEVTKRKPRERIVLDANDTYETASSKSHEYFYYFCRERYNKDSVMKSALFIFLNKTCFRGVFRESKTGFNVPFGHYKNPKIFSKENILGLSKQFNKYSVEFTNRSFEEFNSFEEGDFIYLDPPYYPLNETSFTDYTTGGFDKHEELVQICSLIHSKNARFVHSNSYCEYNTDKYSSFKVEKILCKRSIHSKNPGNKVYEVIISNQIESKHTVVSKEATDTSALKIAEAYKKRIFKVDPFKNPLFLKWIFQDDIFICRNKKKIEEFKKLEKSFGNRMNRRYFEQVNDVKQWTTRLGENLVKYALRKLGHNVRKPRKINGFKPDWEDENYIYEVKTRSFSIDGTAGEKILGTPFKYAEIPKLYGKPLKIVLVGRQEKEAIDKFGIFEPTGNRKLMIDLWKEMGIEFVKFTDMVNEILTEVY